MKKEFKSVKRSIVLALSVMLVGFLVGCGGEAEVTPEPSDTSEEVSETVSEVVSEEISETTTEEVSEVVSEEPLEAVMDLTPYTINNGKFVVDLVADMDYDELKIIVWDTEGAKEVLSNGDSYKIEGGDSLYVYYPQKMTSINPNMDEIEIYTELDYVCAFLLNTSGENIEVAFTATDIDGKEYEITVYLTTL